MTLCFFQKIISHVPTFWASGVFILLDIDSKTNVLKLFLMGSQSFGNRSYFDNIMPPMLQVCNIKPGYR